MLAETMEEYKPTSAGIHLYVEDCDATYKRALEAGATSISPPKDEFYGERAKKILGFTTRNNLCYLYL